MLQAAKDDSDYSIKGGRRESVRAGAWDVH